MAEKSPKIVRPLLIAMKGHPGTGKSTLAHSLASSLKIPLLDKDDVRDSTFFLSDSPPNLLNDLSYNVIWRIASTQLRLGLSVILDSPLSRRSHHNQLLHVASSAGARVLIIECTPSDVDEWRRRLEDRGAVDQASWHKPSTWKDLEKLLEGYGGCKEYDVGDVPKLTVDTTSTADVGIEELVSSAIEFIISHAHASPNHMDSSN